MIFVANNIKGQKSYPVSPQKIAVNWPDSIFKKPLKSTAGKLFKISTIPRAIQLQNFTFPDYFINYAPYRVISADFYSRNFGFFCKKELAFEKKTKIPLRFRLGSIRYTDYLEGKPNSGFDTGY